ncbi:MAG: polysaccharide biosynthesis protein [Gammaproteobacteria bacterium]|nr:polysaccharide biosynthesis protein [Gammaproteobacteria bacterium]
MIRQDNYFTFSEGYELTGATSDDLYLLLLLAIVSIIPVLIITRLYRSITRYINIETYVKITKASVIGSAIWAFIILTLHIPVPRSVLIIFFVLSTLLLYMTRYIARALLTQQRINNMRKVLIYGTSNSSIQIAEMLKNDNNILPIGFIADDIIDGKTTISELKVHQIHKIKDIITDKDVKEILLTNVYQKKTKLQKIISGLKEHQKLIRKLPNIEELTNGKMKISQTKRINIDDLLGRDTVAPDPYLLKACIEGKSVLITGCGGSIGSELARQIIKLNPIKIILLEQSEYFLYEIDHELNEYKNNNQSTVELKSYLGSVSDPDFIETIFANEKIDTVYHAAANKHVPLVEHNPLAAIKTNILGTLTVANQSYKNNIENFVLISSDKAVRPTNIMGATKRFAELTLQSLQDVVDDMPSSQSRTKFCMVRFGNVLDTSGSVVPLFKKQIKSGGPVTVTDPKVIRYFMTISEATELVIQAGSLSKGGDVFLLEMGEPIGILDLAKEMIHLSGKEIKDDDNLSGDIEIKYTGLRDGEKLYEELLIGDNVSKTIHDHIMSANEEKLSHEKIQYFIDKIKGLNSKSSLSEIQAILFEAVSGYKPFKASNVININK